MRRRARRPEQLPAQHADRTMMPNRPARPTCNLRRVNPNLRTPILILAYNRGHEFGQVFSSVLASGPRDIYVFCDGPKNAADSRAQDEIRRHSENFPVGFNVYRNFQPRNLGLRAGVTAGIDWVFETEEMVIILEDDIVATDQFFQFCEDALIRYQFTTKIQQISGYNPMGRSCLNIFFPRRHLLSSRTDSWGWATWRNRWTGFRLATSLPDANVKPSWAPPWIYRELRRGHELALVGSLDSWAYSWAYYTIGQSRLSLVPLANTVNNIGFGRKATHTKNGRPIKASRFGDDIKYPASLKPDLVFVYADSLARRLRLGHMRLSKRLKRYIAWSRSAYSRATSFAGSPRA